MISKTTDAARKGFAVDTTLMKIIHSQIANDVRATFSKFVRIDFQDSRAGLQRNTCSLKSSARWNSQKRSANSAETVSRILFGPPENVEMGSNHDKR